MSLRLFHDFEKRVAIRHITYRRRQTLLAILAVGLAVAITVVSRSSLNGFQVVMFRIIFEMVPHVIVTPKEGDEYIYLYKTLVETIWAMPGVIAVSPTLSTTAALTYEENVENVELNGVIPSELSMISHIGDQYMVEGDLALIQNGKRIVISQKLADELEANLGDSIEAAFPNANRESLVVVGIFSTGVEWDDYAFVSLETAMDFLGEGDVINNIQVKLEDIYQADAVAAEISNAGYTAKSWQRLFPEFLRTIKLESISNSLMMLLIMIISSFGIANVMNMLVLEKTREVGMLMAIGASPSDIRRVFLLESGLLGLIGGLCGGLLGYIISAILNSLDLTYKPPEGPTIPLPFLIDPIQILEIALLAALLSIIAGLYPAHRASRLDPVKALRG